MPQNDWWCRFCNVSNWDTNTKCHKCKQSKKFTIKKDEPAGNNSGRPNSRPPRRRDNSRQPGKLASLTKQLKQERERADKAEQELAKQPKETSTGSTVDVEMEVKPPAPIAKVIELSKAAAQVLGADHGIVKAMDAEVNELREQRELL